MQPETNRIEYKRQLTDKFERSVVAFLNYPGGGRIHIGIDDTGNTIGVPNADHVQKEIIDRITITSYGGLPDGLSPDDFFSSGSKPRNRELMRVFRDVDMVEQIGSGMSRILDAYDRTIFKLTPNFIIVTFPVALPDGTKDGTKDGTNRTSSGATRNATKSRKKPEQPGMITGMITGIETGMKIIGIMRQKPDISITAISVALGMARSSIIAQIEKLKTKGRIRRLGSQKTGYWEIADTENDTKDDTKEILEPALSLIRGNPSITRDEIAAQLDISPRTASRVIKTLVETNQITRAGGRRYGHWKVEDK